MKKPGYAGKGGESGVLVGERTEVGESREWTPFLAEDVEKDPILRAGDLCTGDSDVRHEGNRSGPGRGTRGP